MLTLGKAGLRFLVIVSIALYFLFRWRLRVSQSMHLADMFLLNKEVPEDVEILSGEIISTYYIVGRGYTQWIGLRIKLKDNSLIKIKVIYSICRLSRKGFIKSDTTLGNILKECGVTINFWGFKNPRKSILVKIARRKNKQSVIVLIEMDGVSILEFNK